MLDQAQDSQPQVQKALEGVTALQLRYLDEQGNWLTNWPPQESNQAEALTALPQAVELVLQHRRYGEIRRLLRLPEGVPKRIQQAPQDDAQDPSQPEPSA